MSGSNVPFRRSWSLRPLPLALSSPRNASAELRQQVSPPWPRSARASARLAGRRHPPPARLRGDPVLPRRSSSRRRPPARCTPARSTSCAETTSWQANSLVSASSRLATLTVSPIAVSEAAAAVAHLAQDRPGPDAAPMPMRKRLVELDRELAVEQVQRLGHAARRCERRPRRRAASLSSPNSAMIPSPMNLSTRPPAPSIASPIALK